MNLSSFLPHGNDSSVSSSSSSSSTPTLFGLSLSTHRLPGDLGENPVSYFQHEALIAAISILFFRWTVCYKSEPRVARLFFGLFLATLAYMKQSFELITAVEIFSYAASWLISRSTQRTSNTLLLRLFAIAASAATSIVLSHVMLSGRGTQLITLITPRIAIRVLNYLFPIKELKAAYEIMEAFADANALRQQISHLFFVTFHIQVGMGFLGISFLREEQSRRNDLIRLDVVASNDNDDDDEDSVSKNDNAKPTNGTRTKGGESKNQVGNIEKQKGETTNTRLNRANRFQRGAFPFIVGVALPYMLQIILLGNINKFAFSCVENDMHRTVRLTAVFEHENHLSSLATDSATSPEVYASAMDSVMGKSYDIFNRKLFSLPKVLLLPGVMARQPMLVAQVFPFIFLSDWIKASAVSFMTTKIEELRKETMELKAMRTKVESFDLKHAELLQRSGKGALKFTHGRWEEFTVKIQCRECISDLLVRSKGFFAFMQRNFVFTVLIDCALASLIALGKIVSAEIFVFSRAIEDAVDMVLMRSRSEAELAQMSTEIEKLHSLVDLWDRNKRDGTLIPCVIAPPDHKKIVFRNLHYTRGTASVRADHVELLPGVYALTGPNGSGKSTLFKLLMSCTTNEQRIALPDSIFLLSPTDPLTEEDDLMRENCCVGSEEGEQGVDQEECVADFTVNACVDASRQDHHPVPKLSITMPSSHVVEISQTFYWPLYSRPLSWIYQHLSLEVLDSDEVERKARTVAEQLHSLEFFQPVRRSGNGSVPELKEVEESFVDITEATISRIHQELLEEKEDWFTDLSGGQKSKVELVRKVFLQEKCPEVLLVDETMAPLDPASKALVMAKMKDFCRESVVIVIYHTDVNRGVEVEGETVDCVPSNNFFDKNIHLEHGLLHLRPTC